MTLYQYDLKNMTNTTNGGLLHIMQEVSRQTSYVPGMMVDLSFFLVLFMVLKFKGSTTMGAFAACSFANVIVAILMYAGQMIAGWYLVLCIVAVPMSLFMLWIGEAGSN